MSSKYNNKMLARTLSYSGALPFVFFTALAALGYNDVNSIYFLKTYSVVIIAFLSGIHWAMYLLKPEKCPRNMLVTSNFAALLAWFSLLIPSSRTAFVLQEFTFLYLLILDYKLNLNGALEDWIYDVRRNATFTVCICLCIMMVIL